MDTFCRIRRVFLALIFLAAWCAAQEIYFPQKAFGEGKWANVDAEINSFLLTRLEEPSLFAKSRNASAEAYRFLWFSDIPQSDSGAYGRAAGWNQCLDH